MKLEKTAVKFKLNSNGGWIFEKAERTFLSLKINFFS